jgi:hypothetical protein
MLVGKIIVAYGATTPTAVYSAFDVAYTSAASNGTVTSVGLSLPNVFNVTNSPVTTSGTLTATLASQTAKTFFAAPNGSAGTPSFRTIALADVSTALSTWTGSTAIATVGTVTAGTWNGTKIADAYINSATTWNGKQAAYTNLTSIGSLANASGYLKNNGSGTFAYAIPSFSEITGQTSAAQYSANSICANAMVNANTGNLIPNPNSEQAAPAGGWPAGAYESAGLVDATSLGIPSGRSGTKCRHFAGGDGGLYLTPLIPCAEADSFYFEAWAWNLTIAGAVIRPCILFFNTSGALAGVVQNPSNLGSGGAFAKISVTGVAPTGTAFCQFHINSDRGSGNFAVDDIYASRMVDASLITQGAWASPGPIGSTTPGTGAFTSLTSTIHYLANTAAPPTPSDGGYLYVQNGELKYKGYSGTVTILAQA